LMHRWRLMDTPCYWFKIWMLNRRKIIAIPPLLGERHKPPHHHSFFFNFDKKIPFHHESPGLKKSQNGACSRCWPDSFLYRFGV
jgi:hypothetical protein